MHLQDDKFYFDIQDSLLGRELIAVTRYAKVAGGARKYGGEQVNEQTIQFEKGPNNRIFMRVVSLISKAKRRYESSKDSLFQRIQELMKEI